MTKVSIIIPVYNVAPYLKRSMGSIVNQTLKDIEIIVVDDCSTDNSLEILKEYASKDDRIKLITLKKNCGVSVARNKGLEIAKGEYLGFVDPDDEIDLNFYEELYKKAKEDNADIVKGGVKTIGLDKNITISNLNSQINTNGKLFFTSQLWSAIYLVNLIKNNHIIFPENITNSEDNVFLNRAILECKKLAIYDNTFYRYYKRENGLNPKKISINQFRSKLEAHMLIIDNINNSSLYADSKTDYIKLYNRRIMLLLQNGMFQNDSIEAKELCAKQIIKYFELCKDSESLFGIFPFDKLKSSIKKANVKKLTKILSKYKTRYDLLHRKNNFFEKIFSIRNESRNQISYKVITIFGVKIKIKNPKIDLVYTWVDGNDPEWQKKKLLAQNMSTTDKQAINNCRFVNNDELKYSLRSVEKFMPWINHIFIITDNQIPTWLNLDNPKISIVDHKEIIPKEALPTFNSRVIEHCLVNIPNLSEKFLYSNDDCIVFAPLKPSFFFKNRKPIYRYTSIITDAHQGNYFSALRNCKKLILKKYNKKLFRLPHHNIDPYSKACILDCYKVYRNEIDATVKNKFRTHHDVSRFIYNDYACATKKGIYRRVHKISRSLPVFEFVFRTITRKYSKDSLIVSLHVIDKFSYKIKKWSPKLICLNDNEKTANKDRVVAKQLLEDLFPDKSSYEK